MEWLLSSLKCQLWNNPASAFCFCGRGGNGKGGNWGRDLPLCCWKEDDPRFAELRALFLTSSHCAIPQAVQLPSLLSGTVGQGMMTENSPKPPFGSSLSPACTRTAHSFPCLEQSPHQHQIFISLSRGEARWFLWRGGRQCLARMWEEAKPERSW